MKYFLIALASAVIASQALLAAETPASDPYQGIAQYVFGGSRADITAIEAEIRKTPVEQYPAIEQRLLNVLKDPAATVDGRRFVCRLLGMVGSAKSVPALAELLSHEQLAHPARMALEPMADPSAGAALRAAMPKLKGKLLAGVITSLGMRRDNEAVPAIARAALDGDPAVADAAIRALGFIGTVDAARELGTLAGRVPEGLQRFVAQAQVICAGRLLEAGRTADAAAIYKALYVPQQSAAIRLAAFQGLVATSQGADALKLVVDSLQSGDAHMRAATISAIAGGTKELKTTLVAQLPSLADEAQLAIIPVLADQTDVSVRQSLLRIISASRNAAVRSAALEGLITQGEAGDVPMLINMASDEKSADAAAARKVLERMSRSGVDEALIALVQKESGTSVATGIAVLAARRTSAALPVFAKLARSADARVAVEAIKALEVMGGDADLPALAELIVTTADAAVRDAAEAAASAICSRATDRAACSGAMLAALRKAGTTAARSALLRVLPRVRDEASLLAVKAAAADKEADVRDAAIRALADWPELSAAPHLVELARTADQRYAVLALRGYLRLAAAAKNLPAGDRVGMYRTALELAQRPEEKKQALAGLADVPSVEALGVLRKYAADAALAQDAMNAIVRLSKNVGIINSRQVLAVLNEIKAMAPPQEVMTQIDAAIRELEKGSQADGYIIGWLLAGPYMQEGKDGAALFDVAFDPEKPAAAAKAAWQPIAAAKIGSGAYAVELNKTPMAGSNRVAYFRTTLTSPTAQDAVLHIGSDDGVKVWLNGQVVHSNNATRAMSPGQDKVKVRLRQGENTLLVKLTQGGGEWALCVRICSPDGRPLDNVSVGVQE